MTAFNANGGQIARAMRQRSPKPGAKFPGPPLEPRPPDPPVDHDAIRAAAGAGLCPGAEVES